MASLNLSKLEEQKDLKQLHKTITKEYKQLENTDEKVEFICQLRARSWYWQEEDHENPELAKLYNLLWLNLLNYTGTTMSKADYMDFYYAIDPCP